jgi:hypothetical protein
MPTSRRSPAEQDPTARAPECPSCHDVGFVHREDVLIEGNKIVSFWTCASCLHSWPAPPLRMAKADLRRE